MMEFNQYAEFIESVAKVSEEMSGGDFVGK